MVYNPNKPASRQERREELPLSFAALSPSTIALLEELPREGWVRRGIENPESVQAHIVALRQAASTLEGISEEDMQDLLDMLEIHDWPEAIHGDEVVATAPLEDRESIEELKFAKELLALTSICKDLGPAGHRILELWLRFEKGEDEMAVLARQVDKFQPVAKALEYEKATGKPIFLDFYTYARSHISDPRLVARIESLKEEWDTLPQQR